MNKNNLSDIDYICGEDINLLDSFNQTEHPLKYDDVLDAFNDNLRENPNNNLVSYLDVSYTYAEGAFIADKIAKQLADFGIGSEDCVAFLTNRSEDYMLATLGIMACGAAYVPLDDAHPDERIQFILKDTQSKVVIVSDETYERVNNLSDDIILLNISDIKEDIGTLSSLPVVYGDLACILYTSGTTGIPKGVKITRKSIVNLATVYHDKYALGNDDVYALFSTIGFDAALLAMVVVLYSGACLSVVPADIRLDIRKMNDYFIKQNVTHTLITSQVGKLFMESVDDTSLKVLLVGGEKLGEFESPENYTLVDAFGPTETCVFVSSIRNEDKIDSSSVGMLGYNTKAYVLDNEFRRVPVGATGELCIAGYPIADGYLNRDKENEKAFLKNPFDDNEDYNVIYRTGDMVRILPDGTLGIVGRRDSQVKIRGNRVELSEIESVIREIDFIDDVIVQTIKNGSNNELVAYVVLKDEFGGDNFEDYICEYVSGHKPEYMIPSHVIELDEIPLTVNGKLNKRALPEVDLKDLQSVYVEPETDTEKIIVEAFEKVFNQKIGIYDDFVKLGGDSLTAIKVISLMDIDINPTVIFKDRTPYAIAQNIGKNEYGFELVKKGTKNQNMFMLPPIGGLSSIFFDLVNNIDFDGNIYIIDDFKYGLSLDEIKSIENNGITLDYYYDAIKDIFQNGDILVGFSLGCIYASLILEKLEQNKQVAKCILIDGTLQFVNDEEISTDKLINDYGEVEFNDIVNNRSSDFKNKFIEILLLNSNWNFHTPKIESHITYLATSDMFKEDLDKISDNYEFVLIDSNHKDIIHKDVDKIIKYLK